MPLEPSLQFYPAEYEGRTNELRASMLLGPIDLDNFRTGDEIEMAGLGPFESLRDFVEAALVGDAGQSRWSTQVVRRGQDVSVVIQLRSSSVMHRKEYEEFKRKVRSAFGQLAGVLG